jgi:hypothetical protein
MIDKNIVEPAPPLPVPKIVHDLVALGGIKGIHVEYRQTGVGTAETYWILTGWSLGQNKPEPKAEFLAKDVEKYLIIKPDHASIAAVKGEWRQKYEERRSYEEKHARELAEYHRLQQKFGGVK